MIRSAIDYGRSIAYGVVDGPARALFKAHLRPFGQAAVPDRNTALHNAIGYLLRAQEQGTDAGIGSYHVVNGWGASYPETTGYAIPTLLQAGKHLAWQEPMDAALLAAEWLLSIQRPDGGWQGGRVGEDRPSIVFNTAQVIRGLLAAYERSKDVRFLDSATRAGRWIASVQDADGGWRAHNFLGVARVYDTYVDAPLLELYAIIGDQTLKVAADRNLKWVLAQRRPNGWFANCDNTIRHNHRPITHTIAYTLDGLLDCGLRLNDDTLVRASTEGATILLNKFMEGGTLNGRYDADWHGTEHPIMTGCAQLAIVWAKLHHRIGSGMYRDGLILMTDRLMGIQQASMRGPGAVHGAMPGSYPLWGRYEKFAFPNWGTKYFADALLCAERSAALVK